MGELRVRAVRYPATWKIVDCDRSPMADQCGTPKTKVSTAPALAARANMDDVFSYLALWFLLVPPSHRSRSLTFPVARDCYEPHLEWYRAT